MPYIFLQSFKLLFFTAFLFTRFLDLCTKSSLLYEGVIRVLTFFFIFPLFGYFSLDCIKQILLSPPVSGIESHKTTLTPL